MKPTDPSAPASVTVVVPPERSRLRSLFYGAGLLLAGGALVTAFRPAPVETPVPTLPPVAVVPAAPVVLPAGPPAPAPAPTPVAVTPTQQSPKVDVAFVLDTTGSMGGLISAAKKKIWAVASELADAQPRPEIRIGLVAYRDQGDAYVTHNVSLTDDLDDFYAQLQQLQAMGGGDTPEAVHSGLSDALEKLAWSDDAQVRFMFLVGDAQPHAQQRAECRRLVGVARQRGIRVNTIQCGTSAETRLAWTELAQAGGGDYLQIDQGARVLAVSTPFDGQIAETQRKVEETALFYGDRRQKAASLAQWTSNFSLSSEGYASRSSCLNKTGGFYRQDLLGALDKGKVKLKDLETDELPEELQKLSPEEREAKLAALKAKRDAANARLVGLVAQRDAWIKANAEGGDTFDRKLVDCLKTQGAAAGLNFAK